MHRNRWAGNTPFDSGSGSEKTFTDWQRSVALAREFARWHLGHAVWADDIIQALENPELVTEELRERQASYGLEAHV